MKLRALTLLLALGLTGCQLLTGPEPIRACGEWPYRILSPEMPDRLQEEFYAFDLLIFAADRNFFDRENTFNPWVGFFQPGERLELLRAGDLSGRHVLVVKHGDRYWTVVEELRC